MNWPKSAAVPRITTAPLSSSFFCNSGEAKVRLVAALIWLMMATGVPAGAIKPYHTEATMLG